MFIANARTSTKKVEKKKKKDCNCYAKKGEKWSNPKCSIRIMIGRKRVEVKKWNKQGKEIVINMVTVNPTISEITLNVKDLSIMLIKK